MGSQNSDIPVLIGKSGLVPEGGLKTPTDGLEMVEKARRGRKNLAFPPFCRSAT
jgi:hypothetical protein